MNLNYNPCKIKFSSSSSSSLMSDDVYTMTRYEVLRRPVLVIEGSGFPDELLGDVCGGDG